MIYRVVERRDGLFQCQMRFMFLFWLNSCHDASRDEAEQIDFAKTYTDRPCDRRRWSPVRRVVWP